MNYLNHNKKEHIPKKFTYYLLNVFINVYGVFLYSLALPLLIGAITIFFVPFVYWIKDLFEDLSIPVRILAFIIIGVCFKRWHQKKWWYTEL